MCIFVATDSNVVANPMATTLNISPSLAPKNKVNSSVKIIGIAGASGAGKSRLAHQLHSRLRETYSHRDVSILNEDRYYRRRDELSFEQREKINYDHPEALEHGLLVDHLMSLRQGQTVDAPQYDYGQHNRKTESESFEPTTIIILEGILILHHPELRELMDLKIFVDVALDICLIRRCRRDIQERERTLESVLSQYENSVRPMYFEFIEPTKNYADIIVPRGGENTTALKVLHSHLDRLLASA